MKNGILRLFRDLLTVPLVFIQRDEVAIMGKAHPKIERLYALTLLDLPANPNDLSLYPGRAGGTQFG
jgi:hypothetical protein